MELKNEKKVETLEVNVRQKLSKSYREELYEKISQEKINSLFRGNSEVIKKCNITCKGFKLAKNLVLAHHLDENLMMNYIIIEELFLHGNQTAALVQYTDNYGYYPHYDAIRLEPLQSFDLIDLADFEISAPLNLYTTFTGLKFIDPVAW